MEKESFLSLYRKLEDRVRMVYHIDIGQINQLSKDQFWEQSKESFSGLDDKHRDILLRWSGDLNMFRQVRNVLVHNVNANDDTTNFITVNDIMEERLKDVEKNLFDKIEDVCWGVNDIYGCWIDDRVMDAVHKMREMDYTHVPVVDGERKLIGVFSENTLLDILDSENGCPIDDGTTFGDILDFLSRPGDEKALFAIVKAGSLIPDCVELFVNSMKTYTRLDALFVTADGTADTPVIGLTTVWDLMGR